MTCNMKLWKTELLNSRYRSAMLLFSYCGAQLIRRCVLDAALDGFYQYKSLHAIYSKFPSIGAVTCIDPSLEAEVFGYLINCQPDQPPLVLNGFLESTKDIRFFAEPSLMQESLASPAHGSTRQAIATTSSFLPDPLRFPTRRCKICKPFIPHLTRLTHLCLPTPSRKQHTNQFHKQVDG